MHRLIPIAATLVAIAAPGLSACKSDKTGEKTGTGQANAPEKEPAVPVRVALGDCAGPTARFESGPRPAPFDVHAVEEDMKALVGRLERNKERLAALKNPRPEREESELPDTERSTRVSSKPGEDPLQPARDPDHDEGRKLDEGKMGRRDSGQYAMKGGNREARIARREAIEAAREAGVLGKIQHVGGGRFASLTGTADFSSGLDDANVYGGLLGDEIGEMQGGFGFGRDGFGPGGGGTGWGTIGTGNYGTIGHGGDSKTGGIHGQRGDRPRVRIGSATSVGDLDKNIIRRYIRRKLPQILYCYEKEALVKPRLKGGTVTTQFQIAPSGKVLNAAAIGLDDKVGTCIAGVIRAIVFPKPKGGGLVQVRYPFTFRPSAPDNKAKNLAEKDKTAVPGKNDDKNAAENAARNTAALEAEQGAEKPDDEIASTASSETGDEQAEPYRPGAKNPLGAHVEALEACFRGAGKDHGVLFVEMDIDDRGAVTAARSVGDIGKKTAACVAKVARQASFQPPFDLPSEPFGPRFETLRCPLAFGTMATDAATTIDITADSITYQSEPVAETRAVADDASPFWKIDGLFQKLRAQREIDVLAVGQEPIAITGPRIIRPVDATPMKVVERVLKTTMASSRQGWVLAAQDGDSWRLLHHGLALPVAPVPVNTGTSWWSPAGIGRWATLNEEPPLRISILVQDRKIWLGLGQVDESSEIPRQGSEHDWKSLQAMLTEHKESVRFAGRNDLKIAAEDAVPYKDVVRVIDIANEVGFVHWGLGSPSSLSARPDR